MARIKKEDHARILHLVDVERRPVREIAGEFGCTAANIYSLLAKLRRGSSEGDSDASAPAAVADATLIPDLTELALKPKGEADALPPTPEQPPPERPAVARLNVVPTEARALSAAVPAESANRGLASVEPVSLPERRAAGLGARLAKPGMGLVMRTEDGEETMTPFRSIDDLLSAIKPILRASARGTDPVWFSLQPVDLSAIDVDAA